MIKKIITPIAFLLGTILNTTHNYLHAQSNNPNDSIGYLKAEKATVKKIADNFVLVPHSNPSMRYMANNLPEHLKTEGAEVLVTGVVRRPPPNVRTLAHPLDIQKVVSATQKSNVAPPKKDTPPPTKPPKDKPNVDPITPPEPINETTQVLDFNQTVEGKAQIKYSNLWCLKLNDKLYEIDANDPNFTPDFQKENLKVNIKAQAAELPLPMQRVAPYILKIESITIAPQKKWWQFWITE